MRLTPLRLALLFGAILFLLVPTTAVTQFQFKRPGGDSSRGGDSSKGGDSGKSAFPGGFPSRGGDSSKGGGAPAMPFQGRGESGRGGPPSGGIPGGGTPGGGYDPSQMANMIFDRAANGKESITISEYQSSRDPNAKEKLAAWAQTKGITNGQLTRTQFADYLKDRMAEMQNGGGMRPGGGGPSGGPSGGPGGGDASRDDRDAESSLRRHDKDGDGVLKTDEMSDTLRDEWQKWDTNKNGVIELDEYKEYYKARMAYLRGEKQGDSNDRKDKDRNDPNATPMDDPQDDKRPTVYRVGSLPKDLPSWYSQLDSDRDGQVGLYEWKKGKTDLRLFLDVDKNGDGFLTVEEVLRYQKVATAKKPAAGPTVLTGTGENDPLAGIYLDGQEMPTIPTLPATNPKDLWKEGSKDSGKDKGRGDSSRYPSRDSGSNSGRPQFPSKR